MHQFHDNYRKSLASDAVIFAVSIELSLDVVLLCMAENSLTQLFHLVLSSDMLVDKGLCENIEF